MLGDDHVVERMRLDHLVVAAGEIPFGREGEVILDPARPNQGHGQFHVRRRHRLAGLGEPGPEFGRHAGFENGELEREIAVGEQTSAVRPLGLGSFSDFRAMGSMSVSVVVMGVRSLVEPGRRGQPRQEDE